MEKIEDMEGISIGGKNLNNIRFADDTALLADNAVKLQRIIDKVVEEGVKLGLQINCKKPSA